MASMLKCASLLPWLAASLFLLLLVTPYLLKLPLPVCTLPGATKDVNYDEQTSAASCSTHVQPVGATQEDLAWLKSQLLRNQLQAAPQIAEEWHRLRKGINPRTREQQLADLRKYKGISHYEEPNSNNHTALPCPGELLIEEHHSNYGEPWAGGRDVFEFLAKAALLKPKDTVLEVGCGTLRVGLHFIRYLLPAHYYCVERDLLSLMAAFRYELPSQGLLHKRPIIVRGEDMNFEALGHNVKYDLIYASAVFLHMPDSLVWTGLERLADRLAAGRGRIFVSHNIKFCTRLPAGVCQERLAKLKLKYVGKHTHDSLLFNHYEIWHEFR
ncbi:hypothetical protein L7F22_064475 [Adiantum nelumboides]|nr:hypothetical protein [Adiantum nelumboides]